MLVRLSNILWLFASLPGYWVTKFSFARPAGVQHKILQKIVRKNSRSAFGKQHGFGKIRTYADFRSQVPIRRYEDYEGRIEEIKLGLENVLVSEQVTHLMPSSGSTAARKLIPYTRSLQQEFDRGVSAWVAALYLKWPKLLWGRAYWSITPSVEAETQAVTNVGFDQDSSYLGGVKKTLVDRVMAVNPAVAAIKDIDAFRYVTLLELLKCRDLRLISVWHPSYLTILMNDLSKYWPDLVRDVRDGTVNPPTPLAPHILAQLTSPPDERRAAEIALSGGQDVGLIWRDLVLISCWGNSYAAGGVMLLERVFPGVKIQPKGLIATEAFMSFPWSNDGAGTWLCPLAIRSHFFEFEDDAGEIWTAEQVKMGQEYKIIVTTSGGLYRYAMNDRVRVNGFVGKTPSIVFLGKSDAVSDFYGEKLNDQFVANQIEQIFKTHGLEAAFSMLAPDGPMSSEGAPENYTLFIETSGAVPSNLADSFDELLCANPHYEECRRLGQLKKVKIFQTTKFADKAYLHACHARGIKLGDIKPVSLSKRPGWRDVFTGTYL